MSVGVGINLEFIRCDDKPFEAGIARAAELGFEYVEPMVHNGRELLSEAGYFHSFSMDRRRSVVWLKWLGRSSSEFQKAARDRSRREFLRAAAPGPGAKAESIVSRACAREEGEQAGGKSK